MALVGWQQYRVLAAEEPYPVTMLDEDVELLDTLNVLGHVGLTAYLGVTEVARPEAGEMFLVSAAASGVGSVAGQIAKLRGARVIGIAGGPEKCAWVVDELGFDACIDYKSEDVAARFEGARSAGRRRVLRQRRRRAPRHRAAPPRAIAGASCSAATSPPTTSRARRRRCAT